MRRIIITLLAGLSLVTGLQAQTVVGKRDYFQQVGASAHSNNTVSHFTFNQPTTLVLDCDRQLPITFPADAVLVRNLVGVNKYEREKMTFIYDDVFIFSVQTADGWQHHMPFTGCTHNDAKQVLTKQYVDLQWQTKEYDPKLPSEADVTYIVVDQATGKKEATTKHSELKFTRTSVTFNTGNGEQSFETLSFFFDKMLAKQGEKSKQMLETYYKKGKKNQNKVINSDYSLYQTVD